MASRMAPARRLASSLAARGRFVRSGWRNWRFSSAHVHGPRGGASRSQASRITADRGRKHSSTPDKGLRQVPGASLGSRVSRPHALPCRLYTRAAGASSSAAPRPTSGAPRAPRSAPAVRAARRRRYRRDAHGGEPVEGDSARRLAKDRRALVPERASTSWRRERTRQRDPLPYARIAHLSGPWMTAQWKRPAPSGVMTSRPWAKTASVWAWQVDGRITDGLLLRLTPPHALAGRSSVPAEHPRPRRV